MRLSRWLMALGCLCLLAIPAQADPTLCTFSFAATDTSYAEYGNLTGFIGGPGPGNAANYYRFTQAGIGSTQNQIAFDLTASGPSAHVVADFDFRGGGGPAGGGHADGIGFVLLNTANFGTTGNGPGISEEANVTQSFGLGLDTYNNGTGSDDPSANHLSLRWNSSAGQIMYAVNLTPLGYQIHQADGSDFDDTATPFDHLHMTMDIDPNGAGATVTVTITPGNGAAAITPVSGFVVPFVTPYEMRAGFGARTGGSTDNYDLANVNLQFSP